MSIHENEFVATLLAVGPPPKKVIDIHSWHKKVRQVYNKTHSHHHFPDDEIVWLAWLQDYCEWLSEQENEIT